MQRAREREIDKVFIEGQCSEEEMAVRTRFDDGALWT